MFLLPLLLFTLTLANIPTWYRSLSNVWKCRKGTVVISTKWMWWLNSYVVFETQCPWTWSDIILWSTGRWFVKHFWSLQLVFCSVSHNVICKPFIWVVILLCGHSAVCSMFGNFLASSMPLAANLKWSFTILLWMLLTIFLSNQCWWQWILLTRPSLLLLPTAPINFLASRSVSKQTKFLKTW